MTCSDPVALRSLLTREAADLGFSALSVSRPQLAQASAQLARWVAAGHHGEMDYLAKNTALRADPAQLWPGTTCLISVSLPYLPQSLLHMEANLANPARGYVARYALGQDYHRLMRRRLEALAQRTSLLWGPFSYRPFSDSAPLFEVEIAAQGGLGWRGKHTLLLQRQGSFFFLGELCCDLPLPADSPVTAHCGRCQACLDICPTAAIIAPYELDARRCIAYLTIEHFGPIPEPLRPLMGNRIYGCDDCQLVCPWNRFASPAVSALAFAPRKTLQEDALAQLMTWTSADFSERLAGSPIRRLGHERWLRNLAVALGNGPPTAAAWSALAHHREHSSALVREHVNWAWQRLLLSGNSPSPNESE
ncbi:MAG: tRNA epoxyqueuosine(34) reductase QueG [Ferrovum sp.]|nr:tRNA epoxyqueuosine(34) reductase QueG [Ferrovum sp.]NDU86829.1 tRNA epoxyqueuosine(34) reductase QueG [Ferrovum sp.]